MSERNRLPYAPFGVGLVVVLGLFAVALHNHSNERQAANQTAQQQNAGGLERLPSPAVHAVKQQPPVADPNPERKEWREEQDLKAQREMVDWALGVLIATGLGVVVTAVGVVYVKRTLELNRKLLSEAAKTTRAAEHTVEIQIRLERPLLVVSAIEMNLDMLERIDFSVQNLGRTPAILIEWSAQHNRSSAQIPDQPSYRWNVPVRGTVLQANAIEKLLAWPAIDETSEAPDHNKVVPIFFWGYFRYEDVFGTVRNTGFGYRGFFNQLARVYVWDRIGGNAYNFNRNESEG